MSEQAISAPGQSQRYQKLLWGLWFIILVTLPVTSSPLMARLIGEQQVTPLAGIPLFLFTLLWFVPYLIRNRPISSLGYPLLVFLGLAMLASAISMMVEMLPAWGYTWFEQVAPGLVTLLFGMVIYFIFSHHPQTDEGLKRTLRWLYVGAAFMMIWSSVQSLHIIRDVRPSPLVKQIHAWISIRRVHRTRLVGMTYEPSWLANQLVMLYMPLWVASVVKRFSVYRIRNGWVTVELIFLLWSLPIFFLTYSRVGLVSLFASLGLLVLGGSWELVGRLRTRIRHRGGNAILAAFAARDHLFRLAVMSALIFLLGLLLLLVVYLASQTDPRIEQIFSTNYVRLFVQAEDPMIALARRLKYAERVVYWVAAFRVFSLYPLLGVGLGNTGFFFKETVIPIGYRLPEIISLLGGGLAFPNPKNLWIRLLAETGVIGFTCFVLWLVIVGVAAKQLHSRTEGVVSVIGLAGLLALAAQVFEGFSVDSFALPQLWILPGLVTAGLSIAARAKGGDENG